MNKNDKKSDFDNKLDEIFSDLSKNISKAFEEYIFEVDNAFCDFLGRTFEEDKIRLPN